MPPTGELAEASPEMRRVRDQAVDSSDGAAGSSEVRAGIARRANPSSPRARASPLPARGAIGVTHRPLHPTSTSLSRLTFPAARGIRPRSPRRIAPPYPSAAASTA